MKNGKYVMSKFVNAEDMRKAIMSDMELNDIERLVCIFATMKDEVRRMSPHLYYCLLTIADTYKVGGNNHDIKN